MRRRWWMVVAVGVVSVGSATVAHRVAARPSRDESMAALGRQLFFDTTLSASGRMSCATCHDPDHAYGPPNDRAVQLGGATMDVAGTRAVPSLRYVLNRTPTWYKSYALNLEDRIKDQEPPRGGFGLDGRFGTLHDQAAFPLLDRAEMANASPAAVVEKVSRAAYARDFERMFGSTVLAHPDSAFANVLYAIERFELMDASFHPYDSKFDRYLDGTVQLSAQEQRGLRLFDDPARGGCSACHIMQSGANGAHPLFTDFQFGALGVPRNAEIPANRDTAYFDEGLCGPARRDQASHRNYCGMFKTPSLRNVATRGALFHNGKFHNLKDALRFYVRRDTDPRLWYATGPAGRVTKFDDLPAALRSNVDTLSEPLTKHQGQAPAWTDAEIDDVIAFLQTLTDGYKPGDRR